MREEGGENRVLMGVDWTVGKQQVKQETLEAFNRAINTCLLSRCVLVVFYFF